MPVFIRKNPVELSGDLKANKAVNKLLLEQNLVSGFLGPTKKKSEEFDKIKSMLGDLEAQLGAYMPSVSQAVASDFNIDPNNPSKIVSMLLKLVRITGRERFTLNQLSPDDITDIMEYVDKLEEYKNNSDNIILYIDDRTGIGPNDIDQGLTQPTKIALQAINSNLGIVISALKVKLLAYKAEQQPVQGLTGSGSYSCKWDLDEPLRNNPMYQTQKYVF